MPSTGGRWRGGGSLKWCSTKYTRACRARSSETCGPSSGSESLVRFKICGPSSGSDMSGSTLGDSWSIFRIWHVGLAARRLVVHLQDLKCRARSSETCGPSSGLWTHFVFLSFLGVANLTNSDVKLHNTHSFIHSGYESLLRFWAAARNAHVLLCCLSSWYFTSGTSSLEKGKS